jgi:uncharacterized protein (DUF1330 family)
MSRLLPREIGFFKRGEKAMAAYFLVDIEEITDAEAYEGYKKGVLATVEQYGGRFLVRGGAYEVMEGEWKSDRLVVLEFADKEHFKAWYDSPEYSRLKTIRFGASRSRAVVIQGVE